MLNIKRYILLILSLIICDFCFSQNIQFDIPEINSPETQFISIFQREKIDNPIFLDGNPKEVHKKITNPINPNRTEKVTENYHYILDKKSNLTSYASDVEFDEMNITFLNSERKQSIKNDTILNDEFASYTFKKGKLISQTLKTIEEPNFSSVTDSIHYNYKKNKLIHKVTYQKEILIDFNEYDEEIYLVSDYFMTGYNEAKYTNKNELESKLEIYYEPNTMVLSVSETQYTYNINSQLTAFKRTSRNYEFSLNDLSGHLKKIKNNKFDEIPFETIKSSGVYTYDLQNRVATLITTNNTKESQTYNIKYKKNKTKISRVTNTKPDVEYHFNYDKNNNPIQEKRFIYLDGKKYLDTEITLQITYFK